MNLESKKKALIDFALQEILRHENQKKILELRGEIQWDGDLNKMRNGKVS